MGLYYNNHSIFMFTCVGAEIGSISLFINAKAVWLQEEMWWCAIVGFWSCVLAFKMFVNAHQWQGGAERFVTMEQQMKLEEALKKK